MLLEILPGDGSLTRFTPAVIFWPAIAGPILYTLAIAVAIEIQPEFDYAHSYAGVVAAGICILINGTTQPVSQIALVS